MVISGNPKTEYDLAIIERISNKFKLFKETAEILYNRGITTDEEIEYFLNPGKHHFKDPYLLSGMAEAVDRINQAKEGEETVIVYGDYDADGISATTILTQALTKYGINVVPFVPERASGYGLQIETIDKLIDEYFPDLIITVDCGISCKDEVEYIKNLGVDVIVTDHHELPDVLPDCVVINCKIKSDYNFSLLCGAGVAFKLATALLGDYAYNYLDFCAIATIADSMPLIGENRDIVFEGLKLIRSGRCSTAINELIAVCNVREINSTSLAFTIAPRINAAGRMGDANSALELMLSTEHETAEALAVRLNSFNLRRQQECEELYKNAREKLVSSAYDKKIIILQSSEWNSGLVGIIAARLVEEFSRPVILFVNNEGKLHGSARSIDEINIFEAISACKEYLTDFGGHAQAAGISLNLENFEPFRQSLEQYIDEHYDYSCFKPIKFVDIELSQVFSLKLAKELNLLEPFGTGNRKPLFAIRSTDIQATPIKIGSPHLSIKSKYIDMLYFNGISKLELLNSGAEKCIIFEPNISKFNHEESLKGYVKDIDYTIKPSKKIVLESYRESLLTALNDNDDFLFVSSEMAQKVTKEFQAEHFGTIYSVYNLESLNDYPLLKNADISLYYTANKNLVNNIVVSLTSHNVSGYRKVVYLDRPLGNVPYFSGIPETFICRSKRAFDYQSLDTSKQKFAEIFKAIKEKEFFKAEESVDFTMNAHLGFDDKQLIFALEVFIELGIFYFNKGYLVYNKNVKSSLSASKIFSEVEKLKN